MNYPLPPKEILLPRETLLCLIALAKMATTSREVMFNLHVNGHRTYARTDDEFGRSVLCATLREAGFRPLLNFPGFNYRREALRLFTPRAQNDG